MEDLQALIGMLGGAEKAAEGAVPEETPPESAPEDAPAEDAKDSPSPADDKPAEEDAPDAKDKPAATPPESKTSASAKAFASMRTENAQYAKILQQLGSVLGIKTDPKDPTALTTAIQALTTKAQAQKDNVPEEFMTRLQQLEERDQQNTARQIQENAYVGFQTIKEQFNLSDNDLNSFADSLIASGVNPFTQSMDIVAEYKLRNFDSIMQAAIDKGVQQEAERAANAGSHSSTPSQKTGQEHAEPDKITSMADLTRWMESQKS